MKILSLTAGEQTIIDDGVWKRVSSQKWCKSRSRNNIYACRNVGPRGSVKKIYLHRLIMGAQKGQQVDHINGNTLDNRRENLRLCTNSQNHANIGLYNNNKSGFKGVYFCRPNCNWVATIHVRKKRYHLGSFSDALNAAKAYNAAAIKFFGPFAYLNEVNIK